MNRFFQQLHAYCESYTTAPDQVLDELERETHLKTLAPQMLSGRLQGQLLRFLSRMIQPRMVLEIGTFTGYAAICLAEGLQKGGVLHTIEANAELEYLIRKYIGKAGLDDRIQLHIGQAETIIPELDLSFELVFIDAGKNHYALFYDLIFEKVTPGGYILVDNVLWSGKVLEPEQDQDSRTIHAFNEKIRRDGRVEQLMLPVRDGVLLVWKKP